MHNALLVQVPDAGDELRKEPTSGIVLKIPVVQNVVEKFST